jgi:hypothetical protein
MKRDVYLLRYKSYLMDMGLRENISYSLPLPKCGDVILIRLLSYLLMDVVVEFYIGTLPLLFRFVSVFENGFTFNVV